MVVTDHRGGAPDISRGVIMLTMGVYRREAIALDHPPPLFETIYTRPKVEMN